MSTIEFYAKFKIHPGRMPDFKRAIYDIATDARRSRILRCDWFIHEGTQESVAMVVYPSEVARVVHFNSVGARYDEIAGMCDSTLQFLGDVPASALVPFMKFNPRVLPFAYGIRPISTTIHSALGIGGKRGIEIYTRFDIFPGHLESCKQVGADLIPIVSSKDPGTTRYDWFYDDEKLVGVAMDAYADTPSMFAHMKNAHDVHEMLFEHSTMITEFLGELPPEAAAAVARYNPYVLPLYVGLGG